MSVSVVRHAWTVIVLATGLQLAAVQVAVAAAGNLVVDGGFERGVPGAWSAAGTGTTVHVSGRAVHSGHSCLVVSDNGDQTGQANTTLFPAVTGLYYAQGWLKCSRQHQGGAVLDVQFFAADKSYLGAEEIGETQETTWTRLSGVVVAPDGCAYVRLRVMPAWAAEGRGELHGVCFVDDVYLAPVETARARGVMDARQTGVPVVGFDSDTAVGHPPPDLAGKPAPFPSQVDFEDLSGWTMDVSGDIRVSFCRSRKEQLRGDYVGRLTFATSGRRGSVVLHPPHPIPVSGRFDGASVWCRPDGRTRPFRAAPRVTVLLRERGRVRSVSLPPAYWSFWSVAHRRLKKPIGPDAQITGMWIGNLHTERGRSRTFFFDELAFHREPTRRVDLAVPAVPCPTRPDTILPTFNHPVTNDVFRDDRGFVFRCVGDERVSYHYHPRTGSLADVTVGVNGAVPFSPAAGGGPVLVLGDEELLAGNGAATARLLWCRLADGVVTAVWRYAAHGDVVEVTWRLKARGKSLVLTVAATTGKVARWLLGKPAASSVEEIAVPYLTNHCGAGPVYLVDRGPFVFRQPDWYVTHASAFTPDACEYTPLTNGVRNPLFERIFLTVSSDFHEVLPNIPNPPSSTARVLGRNVYVNMSGSLAGDGLHRSLLFWREMKRLGMSHVIVKHHAHTFSSHSGQGDEPFVQRVHAAANIPGGDAALARYIRQVRALGYEYFLYTDYCIVAPVCRHFDEGLVSVEPDGQWKPGWYQYFGLTPLMAPVLAARLAPRLKAKYGLTGSYCDQHTAAPPSRWVDFDPRKPGAGMLQTVFRAYCKVFQIEKQAYHGPVVSEGGNYWFYAGMVDGNYAQLRAPRGVDRWEMPFLVDFDLLKIHPLEVDLGMGWRRAYGYDAVARNPDDALDRFLAACIAFGHSGILYGDKPGVGWISPADPLGKWKRSIARVYFMMQQLAARYAQVPVTGIRYWDGTKLLSTSEALRSGAYKRSQVAVDYRNGLRVRVNGSFTDSWRVTVCGRTFTLPPQGWCAADKSGFLEYSAVRNGRRVDYVRSPAYTFADGRGVATDFPGFRTDAALILLNGDAHRHRIAAPMVK